MLTINNLSPLDTPPSVIESRPITDVREAMRQLPGYEEGTVRGLLALNRGKEGSNMTTLGLEVAVRGDEAYSLLKGRIERVRELFVVDLEERVREAVEVRVPRYCEVEATWDDTRVESGEGNNILGDNGRLYVGKTDLEVPVVDASDEVLAYFGATIVPENTPVRFPGDVYPLFRMNVGENYVRDFVMSTEGGGYYLEFHTDQPHFHMPVKGGGYYMLARWNDEKTHLHITAFRISDGKAVYTRKGAIHCDAALTGELIVGYTISSDCSTVLLRATKDDPIMTRVNFI